MCLEAKSQYQYNAAPWLKLTADTVDEVGVNMPSCAIGNRSINHRWRFAADHLILPVDVCTIGCLWKV